MSTPARGLAGLAVAQAAVEEGKDPNPDIDPKAPDRRTRVQAALNMAIVGAPYHEIAKVLGYASPYHARSAVEAALAAGGSAQEERDRMRELTARRLDRLLWSVMPRATNPADPDHLAYNARALALVDRQARLYGVDAPAQAIVYSPDAVRVEAYIAQVVALARGHVADAEAEIIEADTEEG